jgi:hypothetical protein
MPGGNRFCTLDYAYEDTYATHWPDLVMEVEFSACCAGEDWSVTRTLVVPVCNEIFFGSAWQALSNGRFFPNAFTFTVIIFLFIFS